METLEHTPSKKMQAGTLPIRHRYGAASTKTKATAGQKNDAKIQHIVYSYPKNGLAGLL